MSSQTINHSKNSLIAENNHYEVGMSQSLMQAMQGVAVLPQQYSAQHMARQVAFVKDKQDEDRRFFIMDCGELIRTYDRWTSNLPRVQPFYAVKCNNDPVLCQILASLGVSFDVASKAEIDLILETIGVTPDRLIFANPCKTRSHLRHAAANDVRMMTFDNENELLKITELYPDARLILRIAVSDETADCPLSQKFGAEPSTQAEGLLATAAHMQLNVQGISFHIGSGAHDATAWAKGIEHARRLFDVGAALGHDMQVLDIGGGFVAVDGPGMLRFETAADTINVALEKHFPAQEHASVRVIAEPGRFFAQRAYQLATHVYTRIDVPASRITKQETDHDQVGQMYYMDDGVYGSFNCIYYDPEHKVTPKWLFEEHQTDEVSWAMFWGPTCDSMDCVIECIRMPVMPEGSWLWWTDMGAYTQVAATSFNGFPKPDVQRFISQNDLSRLLSLPAGVMHLPKGAPQATTSSCAVGSSCTSSDVDSLSSNLSETTLDQE